MDLENIPPDLYRKYKNGAWIVRVELENGEEIDFEVPSELGKYRLSRQGRSKSAKKAAVFWIKENLRWSDDEIIQATKENRIQLVRIPKQLVGYWEKQDLFKSIRIMDEIIRNDIKNITLQEAWEDLQLKIENIAQLLKKAQHFKSSHP